MFAHFFAVASFVAFVVASPLAARGQCNTGSIFCCNSVQQASDVSQVLGVFHLSGALTGVTGQVGLKCSPLTLVGTGSGGHCQQEPLCCTGNVLNGLINTGCSPINANA